MVTDVEAGGRALDRIVAVFDDPGAVANAGLLLPATLASRLGLEAMVDASVRLGSRPGAARAGAKVLSLVHAMLLGADSIDDAEVLRAGQTGRVLGHRVLAPSTLGTFLRSFSFGHVRQLDRVLEQALQRAWAAGAGPGQGRLMIDLDSFLCEVHSQRKQGARIGYTHRLGYHPLIATRADTLETLHIRLRTGAAHTSRGILRFIDELAARVRRAGAEGELVLRADAGFWSHKTIARLGHHDIRYSLGVPLQPYVRRAIEALPEQAWQPLQDYPPAGGIAEIAETALGSLRLVVRRIRGTEDDRLFPHWRYLAFVTDRPEPLAVVEAEHRQHAVIELAIRDHKAGPLRHFPSGRFGANAAWTVISALAANLARWTSILGLADPTPRAAATLRRRLLTTPGRLVRSGRTTRLRLPTRWPWHTPWLTCLHRLRTVPLRC